MKILAVSDVVINRLYHPRLRENFPGVDLVLGCGDLPFAYLEFLVSVFNVPLLYVPGNHDPQFNPLNPTARADGCLNIDGRLARVGSLTLAGLGGSIRYKPDGANQYTQFQMSRRVLSLAPSLLWSQLTLRRRLDILVAHSPPRGIHDDDDRPHVGFDSFLPLIRVFKPRYFLHGHTLNYRSNLEEPQATLAGTQVININPYRLLEVTTDVG